MPELLSSRTPSWALILAAALVGGCGGGVAPVLPDAGESGDSGVAGSVDGGTDAGPHDAGEPADAGEPLDAGQVDGGVDAGAAQDAGTDAGTPDACGPLTPLVFNAAGVGSTSGSLPSGPGQLSDSSCLSSGAEVTYVFTITSEKSLTARVRPVSGDFRPTLLLRGSPCGTSRKECSMYAATGEAELSATIPAGTWHLVVDSDGTEGFYVLDATLSDTIPRAGDGCESPYRTSLSGSTIGSQMSGASLTGFANDGTTATCDGSGADLVYKLNLTEARKVTLSLAASSSPSYRPVLYLQRGTCDTQGSLECAAAPSAGGTADLSFPSLPPGTYFIWLDGHSGTSGGYTFSYSLEAP